MRIKPSNEFRYRGYSVKIRAYDSSVGRPATDFMRDPLFFYEIDGWRYYTYYPAETVEQAAREAVDDIS